ncbi:EF-hand domain-containing protein [Stenotrophomonas sp. S39]|uniref:EF-hand domain-containing protein n=2 Tax=unclassified Stenotrophomonas TaxID=196198 RepID=UPI00190D6C4C|nr:EF-hand domain-containing protein [Stenotrophomonas sp. S39]MBK0056902.1 EF-hand domain-containing protein [Stenotrophomonas sp. S39]
MIRTPLLLALLLGTSATGIALAADTPATATAAANAPAQRHAKLDTNGDGVIDRSEAAANPRLAAKFDALDKNKDGKLSRDELPRWKHGRRGGHGAWMAKLDVNKDGRISREEAKADPRLAARFDQMDVNKDGYLDKADRELRMKQHRDAWFAAADTNKDGQLSKAEFDAAKGPMHGGPRHGGPRDGNAPKPPRN